MDAEAQLPEVFLGRQPILDRNHLTIGYEFLFRTGPDNSAHITDGRAATADVVCKAFAELGVAHALGSQRAFINVSAEFLFDDVILFLPSRQVVLNVDLADVAGDAAIARCRELSARGYEFCLSGIVAAADAIAPMLDLAAYVRVNVDRLPADEINGIALQLQSPRRKLIAGRVETDALMRLCVELGFDHFQGYYFAYPVVIEGRKLDTSTQALMRLVALFNQDADVSALERAFKTEPALAVNLLRLTNSVGAGLAVKIGSVRHAITVLGRNQLQRWLQLLLFAHADDAGGIAANPLMQLAALRAYLMELLAGRCYPAKKELRDKAFVAGLMSLMPAALGMPLEKILDQTGLTRDVSKALLQHEGEIGLLLELVDRYDRNDVDGTVSLFRNFGGRLTLPTLALCLTEAMVWAQQLDTEAEN